MSLTALAAIVLLAGPAAADDVSDPLTIGAAGIALTTAPDASAGQVPCRDALCVEAPAEAPTTLHVDSCGPARVADEALSMSSNACEQARAQGCRVVEPMYTTAPGALPPCPQGFGVERDTGRPIRAGPASFDGGLGAHGIIIIGGMPGEAGEPGFDGGLGAHGIIVIDSMPAGTVEAPFMSGAGADGAVGPSALWCGGTEPVGLIIPCEHVGVDVGMVG